MMKEKEPISKELVDAARIPLILFILLEKDNYGYDIIREIENLSGGVIILKEGTLYPILNKMEDLGYLRSYPNTEEQQRGERARKYYSIQAKGKKSLIKKMYEFRLVNEIFELLKPDKK